MAEDLKPEEQYIVDESPEINIGERAGWAGKILTAFPALKYRDYRLYFFGQLISLIGTWLQIVASGWLVLKLTNSAFLLGLVAAVGSLPILIFSLFGGVIVDRFEKKKILIFTESFLMVLAFIFGFLTILKLINIYEIMILAFFSGLTTAVDMPARQAYMVEVVGKEDLSSAIALNSGIFNGARIIGPGLAGILIEIFGTGGAFILNGISFIAVIIALFMMKAVSSPPKTHPNPFKAIKEGVLYSWSHPIIRILLLFTCISSVFGWSYSTILPLIVERTFHGTASNLGYFYSATGVGALLAALIVSAFSKKINPTIFILGGSILFSIFIIIFSFITKSYLAYPLLFMAGFGLIMQFSTMNTVIQHLVTDKLRGRVMSIYTLMFIGMTPIGSFQIGYIAEYLGAQNAIRLGALIVLVFCIYIYLNKNKIANEYKKNNSV